MSGWLAWFDNKSMGFKLTAVFSGVVLIPMMLLAFISYNVINSRLEKESHARIESGLRVAWTEYFIHGDQMRYGMLQAASMKEIKNAVKRGDRKYLKEMMVRWKQQRPYVDVWTIIDADKRVIVRLNTDATGDIVHINGLIGEALLRKEAIVSSEILPKESLLFEGEIVNEKVVPSSMGREYLENAKEGNNKAGVLAMTVVTPVLDESNRPLGAIITADIINNDDFVPASVAMKMPGVYMSISVNGARVATNVKGRNGFPAIGSLIPQELLSTFVYQKSITTGVQHLNIREWKLNDETYLSEFDPIRNFKGEVIGTLDAGISKEKLWVIQRENQLVIAGIALIGLVLSFMVAYISTWRIVRPLNALSNNLGIFATGDMSVNIDVDQTTESEDEIKLLSRSFNSMMQEVRLREEERAAHLGEIERSNREFEALNKELVKTNEELEVAYEENQSQNEELHSINEELKLLNDDLDRKNVELKTANELIRNEENELKQAKDKLRLIYDSIQDNIVLVGYDCAVQEANRFFLKAFKINESAVVGRNIYGFFSLDMPHMNCPVRKAIETSMPVEIEMSSPGGKIYNWQAYPLIEGFGEPTKAVLYIRDMTNQRLMTQQLIQSDKLSSLGELVSGVAHELNNPLTGIMVFSELLMEHPDIGQDVLVKLAKINDASQRCKKIIENLLTFARWKKPERKFESVNKVIKECVDLMSYQFKIDNIELKMALDEDLPNTMIDDGQIHQVFLNLINNARDAIKDRGPGGNLTITSLLRDGKIFVEFRDTGKGMPTDVVAKIFDPFFTTKSVGRGTGLGLSISYGIINEHGGNINVRSKLNEGTIFEVALPVVARMEVSVAQPAVQGQGRFQSLKEIAQGRALRALVLDDEPIVLDLLRDMLGAAGFAVVATHNGVEALQNLKGSDYDVIISDIKMPGLDGRSFYKEAKNIKPEMLSRIIFITGDSVNKDTQKFLREIGNNYLKKPFTISELNEVISRVVG